jgi:hypothetical protein
LARAQRFCHRAPPRNSPSRAAPRPFPRLAASPALTLTFVSALRPGSRRGTGRAGRRALDCPHTCQPGSSI